MKTSKTLLASTALLLAVFHPALHAQGSPKITKFESQGNLQSTNALECIPVAKAKNTYTPADIYKAVAKCIEDGNTEDGIPLYALAGVYGRFDTLRVSDTTAHQALLAMQMEAFGPIAKEKVDRFRAQMSRDIKDEQAHATICTSVREIGPPDYYPRYMVQHGMGAFYGGSGDGLVAGFDAEASWNEALDKYLHCPQA